MKHVVTCKKSKGFTLIELMIVVAIIAIVATIALPAYQQSLRKSKRSDAKGGLVDAASRLEQYYLDNKQYTIDMTDLGYSSANGVYTADSHYKMTVTAGSCGSINSCYTITAVAQGDQASDSCGDFTINSLGIKTPSDCW
jgi:type IV pilus assembly protein PilE